MFFTPDAATLTAIDAAAASPPAAAPAGPVIDTSGHHAGDNRRDRYRNHAGPALWIPVGETQRVRRNGSNTCPRVADRFGDFLNSSSVGGRVFRSWVLSSPSLFP